MYGTDVREIAVIPLCCVSLQNAKVDHRKAIKEYSGSAADKVCVCLNCV